MNYPEISKLCNSELNDYEVECEINQGTMFPCLERRCNCGQLLGYFQRSIESEIGNLLSQGISLSDARIQTFQKLQIFKECCLRTLTMYPFYTYNDAFGIDSFVDSTYVHDNRKDSIRKTHKNSYFSNRKSEPNSQQKPFTNYGTKGYSSFYPVSFSDFFDVRSYESKIYKIPRKNKDVEQKDEEIARLAFPTRELNLSLELIPTTIPVPFSDE